MPCIYSHARGEFLYKDVPFGEFIYLVFTHMPGESFCTRMYLAGGLYTLYLLTCEWRVSVQECTFWGVDILCIYSHASREFLYKDVPFGELNIRLYLFTCQVNVSVQGCSVGGA